MNDIMQITEDQLDELQSQNQYIVLTFCAQWCGSCEQQLRALKQVTQDMEGTKVQFVKVDIDEEPMLCGKMEVKVIPATFILKGKILISRLDGYHEPEVITQILHVAKKL